jgi:hypothetical protein
MYGSVRGAISDDRPYRDRQLFLRRLSVSREAASQSGLKSAHPMVKTPKIIANGAKTSPPNQFV